MPWDRIWQVLTLDATPDQVRAIVRFCYRGGVLIHILFACGWLTIFGLSGFARAEDNASLKQSIAQLAHSFDAAQAQSRVDKLEAELAGVEQEMFLIRAKLSEATRLGQQADALYSQRLSSLESKHGAILRQLQAAQAHPALSPRPRS
jgi:hypothetical protein